jgi:amino acid adenylation domain-containing protein
MKMPGYELNQSSDESTADNLNGNHRERHSLTESERRRVLYEWNDTRVEFPALCAHQLFEQQVEKDPDSVAVVFNEQRLTYRELNQRANQIAHYLRGLGVGPDSLVGVCLQRSPEMVAGLLGVWKAGGAYVPLDPSYPKERLAFMVSDAAVQVLLTEKRCEHLFSPAHSRTVRLDSDWPLIARESQSNPDSGATPSDLAYVMYTSGSTGTPKGAMILQSGLVNYLTWAIKTYGVKPGGSVPVHSSISFDLTVTSLYTPLLAGARVELLAEDAAAQSLLAALQRQKGRSLVKITPAHLELLSQQLTPDEVADMTNVFVIGGENLLAEKLRMWREFAPATRLINEYGPTETVVGCCVYEVQADDPRNGSVPIGRPIDNTQLYVLDSDLQPIPVGETGELYIGGAGVARGYWNRPELTEERFLPDPFSGEPGARMYKSGDLARYRPDGILEYLGRADNQVKVRGYRIELGEIEATLASHPGVQSCAVLAREDEPGDRQLVGYVRPAKDQSLVPEELRTFLEQRLPAYMVPAHFVLLGSLPLTPNGKVDRKALPAPSNQSIAVTTTTVAPRTGTEKALAAIWAELLKVDAVGVDDNFFDLGGHSLMVFKALSRIRDVFAVDLPVQDFFENPTIAEIAKLLPDSEDSTVTVQRMERHIR